MVERAHTARHGANPEIARRRIEAFARRFGQAHLRFAQHAAFPLALTPDLAYRLWANFQRDIYGEKLGIPWIAVADLLLSSLCEEVGHELYEMQSAIRNILLGELQANPDFGPARVRELSHFLLKQIERQLASPDPDIRDLAVAQQWTALTYIHPDDAVRELAQALRVSLEQQDIPEQLRLASLIETFTQPLADAGFAPLLTYTRGVERLAHGDTENARAHFSQIATTETSAEIQGMSLPLPQLVHEQDRAIAEQTGKKPPASSQPGSVPISAESTSKLQQRIYDFLVEYIQTRGRPPTRREIAQAMNIASLGHVDLHLALLEKKGLIRHEAKKSRGITLVQPPLVDAPMTESGDAQETNSESNGSIDTSVPTTEPETSIAKLAALNEKILVTQNFANAFHQLTEKKRAITAQKIEFLFHNPRHPSLHTKRLQSRVWVCSIDSKTRLLYQIQQDTLRLWYLGNHEIVERIDRLNFAPSTSFSPFSELSAMRPEADNIQHPSEHPEKSQFPLRVFYSSATVDKKWLERLKQYLQPLKQEGLIVDWGSFEIRAGEERKAAIDRHLNAADIILLLISSAFLASDFCYGIEMKRAIERSQAREAHVIPILLRPVADWPKTLFGTSQALPRNGKSVSSWSNPDEAFLDIVNGIRQLIEEIAERPATSTYPREPRIWNVPYPRNPLFTGGEAELQAIADALKTGKRASLGQAISGLGGIGKTQLALEYAYRHRNEYQYVFWLLADTRESLDAGYSNLAVLLALPRASRPGQRFINEAVKGWLATHSGWLLVLDNADDLSLIDEYLPPACPGHLLLTTRARSVGGPIEHIEVARLSASESVSFLLRRSSLLGSNQSLDTISSDQLALAQEIVRELGELPLALDQAGAYIEETNCGLQGYLRLYNKERQELLRIRGNWTASHPESVATTWQLAFDKVEKADFAAADLLRLCAFLAPSNIPEAIIVAGEAELTEPLKKLARNPLRLNAAVAELQKYSLISRDSATSMLSVHHLVQAVLRDAMANSVERAWALRTMRILNCVFPTPIQGNREKCELLLPHVIVCTELIERWQMDTREASQLLQKAGAYLIQQGKYKEAEALIPQSLAIQERTVGLEHLDVVTTLNNLAMIYRGQGKNEQAELLFQRALAIRRNVLGEEHPETAVSLNNLPELQENRRISQEKMDRGEYDVFISYNHQDRERVLEIGELLKDHGLAPFLDEWSLRPGLTWQTALEEQVRTVKAAAICIGAAGMGSWHRKEMDAFERECEKRSLPVIPVLLPDIPSHKDLPIFLEGMTRVDFREKDPDPLERLIWGITGGIVNLLRGWKSL